MKERQVLRGTLFIPALIALIAYLPALRNDFAWDDKALLYTQSALLDPSLFWPRLAHFLGVWSPNYFRPVGVLTFFAEAQIWGLSPAGFHLTNVLLHAFNTLFVTLLAHRLFSRRVDPHRRAVFTALTGLLYGLHPALVESVAFTSSRFDLLMTLWVLLALLADTHLRRHDALRLAAIGAVFFVAALTKETAIVLPIVLFLWRLAIDGATAWQRQALPTITVLAVAALASLGVRWLGLGYLYRPGPSSAIPTGDSLQHLLLVARSLLEYAMLAVFPFTQISPLHVTTLPVPQDDPVAWAGVVFVVLLAGAFLAASRRLPQCVALVGAGLIALLPALNILPLELVGGAFAAERYLALPFALFALAWCAVVGQSRLSLRAVLGVAAVWLGTCLVVVELTLPHWHDDLSLWTWAARRAPSSALPHIGLSDYFIDRGDNSRALAEADAAIERDPAAIKAWNNRGVALFNSNQLAAAQSSWETATRLAPEYALAWSNLANALGVQGRLDEAERILIDQVLRLDPDLPLGRFSLGELYLATDRPALAIPQFERALQLVPPNQQQAVRESLARARAAARAAQ